ncbi:hypothetical protein BO86DRAFT_162708 [Aspergillus japonicus CBS 114.51]|uniref:Uncharacterized protein n=2 Tax=Aspergillus TaxID=5052 RepID=A0A2V5HKK8_ASPV1|nr:hypothetical protein BO86DRAFT_162708 [Aspergillus japonicus CBS 114.51]PYI22564.1 hypothetical protein BO99DRAFT_9828 [Aspergillus violaceofuscus CBS 115571]RAH85650.1 hypothetical protein BO86DRAFT_162708 [Aspergillus japonicus CBS 114.51]
MSTQGYTDCVPGTFYGLENKEVNPGDILQLRWGAIDNGDTPLNISLGRAGGTLIDEITVGAKFTTTSSLYQLVVNETANCTLEQYTWAIPSDFNTTNPQYQIGLFNATAKLGTYGIDLYGWISWSDYFYVREKGTATTTATTSSTTATSTGSAQSTGVATSITSSSASSHSSSSSSSSVGIGVGVGVGVGAAAVIGALAFFFLRRRKKRQRAPVPTQETSEVAGSPLYELPAPAKKQPVQEGTQMYELQG